MKHLSQRPTSEKERYAILDVLRGFALIGIALANFPEFGLWTFLSSEEQMAMPSAEVDRVVLFLEYFLVDGKFYTIFSLLFGIGFSLILSRRGSRLFFRRMLILMLIGAIHLMFLWSGDILLLYSVGGLLLLTIHRLSDKILIALATLLILLPIGLDALTEFADIDFAAPFYRLWWQQATAYGINEDNFASWLRDADSYGEMFAFLIQGACERIWEFVGGHRLPKVVGLFIFGYLIGKHHLFAKLHLLPLVRISTISAIIGVPMSLLYAWSATNWRPLGITFHSLLYALSVIPMALFYIATLSILYIRCSKSKMFLPLAASGRMALTCYISQSVIGIMLFYGIGLGLGTSFGLIFIELTAIAVFFLQTIVCILWLRLFRFGLLEWVWRMATYGRYFPLLRSAD